MRISIANFTFFLLFCNCISGQKVEPIGSGLTMIGTVYDIAIDESTNKTYVVGDFSAIDGIPMEKVGVLENGVWAGVPNNSEIDGVIYSAEFFQGNLYIAGNFTIPSSRDIINLAKLENGVWKGFGIEPMFGTIRDLRWFEDDLFITGSFASLNGVKNNGVMKFSDAQWKNAGVNSFLNGEGFLVMNDTLFAWGSKYDQNGEYYHAVSFTTDGKWTTLPNFRSDGNTSSSCVSYKGEIYCTNNNDLYRFDFIENEWKYVETLPLDSESPKLFEHQEKLFIATEKCKLFCLKNGTLEEEPIKGINNNFSGSIHAFTSHNGQILIGGNFHHWDSESVSLSSIAGMSIAPYGKISSNFRHKNAHEYAIARSIVKYHDKFLIAGRFSFADHIYSPNFVYWDGTAFSPFEEPLPDEILQLEVFEGDLYAVQYNENQPGPITERTNLKKYDGTHWEDVPTPLSFNKIRIINDKLFIDANHFDYSSRDGGPFYLKEGNWEELKAFPADNPIGIDYRNINSYNGGYLMKVTRWPTVQLAFLSSDTSEWQVLDTVEVRFDNVRTHDDQIYLTNKWPSYILKVSENQIDTISKGVETTYVNFFKIMGRSFYSSLNGNLHQIRDKLEYYNSLNVMDIEELAEGQYLLALQGGISFPGPETPQLNNIALLSFDSMALDIRQDYQQICPKEYVQYWPETNHLNLEYYWEFEGGTPAHASATYPMVKYDSVGTYLVSLTASNIDGDTIYETSEIHLEECEVLPSRANNYDNHWIMGYEYAKDRGLGGFDFSFPNSILSPRYHSPKDIHRGNTAMSDIDGNLQFYSNGLSIWNMHNEKIKGSDCFNSNLPDYTWDYFVSNQSVLSLPDVEKKDTYHLFDIDPLLIEGANWYAGANLSMTSIDMSKNNGYGEIVNCNEELIEEPILNSTMQATRHENGKDWWIIVGKFESDEYYKILFTKNGIESIETAHWDNYYSEIFSGQSTFSPDGQYYVQVIKENQEIYIWKFDNSTGELYDQQSYTLATVDDTEHPFGCSFSPDSRFLYVSSLTQLRQIDLCIYDKLDVELIDSWDGTYEFVYPLFFGKQMLTPNQKIIVAPPGNGHSAFGVINQPNKKGMECDFKQHSIRLSEFTYNHGDVIPIFPHFRTYPSYEEGCGTVSTENHLPSDSFSAYPNPIHSQSILHFSQKTTGNLFNTSGQLIYSFSNSNYLDIKSLSPGVYFLVTGKGTKKIIIQ